MTKEQMHDFMDGKGPVPSHIHTKGGGSTAMRGSPAMRGSSAGCTRLRLQA